MCFNNNSIVAMYYVYQWNKTNSKKYCKQIFKKKKMVRIRANFIPQQNVSLHYATFGIINFNVSTSKMNTISDFYIKRLSCL